MAAFYGVSLSVYQAGQAWMAAHPTQTWFEISDANNRANLDAGLSKFYQLEQQSVQ